MIILPIIIIKKILNLLIYDFINFKDYLLISKEYHHYLIKRIDKIELTNQNQIDVLKNNEYLKNNIKSIIVINRDLLKYDHIKIFYNLKNIKINLLDNRVKNSFVPGLDFAFLSNGNKVYNIKIKSFWYHFQGSDSQYSRLKKIEFPNSSVDIRDLNKLLEDSHQSLTSIDIGLKNRYIYLDDYTMFELELDEDEERAIVLSNISRFDKLLKRCKNLKKLSLRDSSIWRARNWNGHLKNTQDSAYASLQDSINSSILHFTNLSKLCLYGIFIKSVDFFDCLSQVKNIKCLKLIMVNFNLGPSGNGEIFNQFIHYLYGNKKLVKLSIRDNNLGSSQHQNDKLLNYLLQSTQLSNLNIAYNDFNLLQLFNQIYTNKRYQFSKIAIADNQLLPFNYFISTNITNLINIKYYHGNKKIPIILNNDIILKIRNEFYNPPIDFADISFN